MGGPSDSARNKNKYIFRQQVHLFAALFSLNLFLNLEYRQILNSLNILVSVQNQNEIIPRLLCLFPKYSQQKIARERGVLHIDTNLFKNLNLMPHQK